MGKSGFHVWRTKTKDFSLAPFVRPQAIVHYIIVICVYCLKKLQIDLFEVLTMVAVAFGS